ncbi:hypothetical protein BDR03DRAFT_956576 [Suillus americanus]|nr:hypothetical protein BDR03DRAFT_956576 [Suillus americanus]
MMFGCHPTVHVSIVVALMQSDHSACSMTDNLKSFPQTSARMTLDWLVAALASERCPATYAHLVTGLILPSFPLQARSW